MKLHTLYRYHSPDIGNYLAIPVLVGHKWIHYVSLGYPIALHKVRIVESKHFTDLDYKNDAVAKFMAYSPMMGITQGAEQALLKGAK